jgi:hypothetical protein
MTNCKATFPASTHTDVGSAEKIETVSVLTCSVIMVIQCSPLILGSSALNGLLPSQAFKFWGCILRAGMIAVEQVPLPLLLILFESQIFNPSDIPHDREVRAQFRESGLN